MQTTPNQLDAELAETLRFAREQGDVALVRATLDKIGAREERRDAPPAATNEPRRGNPALDAIDDAHRAAPMLHDHASASVDAFIAWLDRCEAQCSFFGRIEQERARREIASGECDIETRMRDASRRAIEQFAEQIDLPELAAVVKQVDAVRAKARHEATGGYMTGEALLALFGASGSADWWVRTAVYERIAQHIDRGAGMRAWSTLVPHIAKESADVARSINGLLTIGSPSTAAPAWNNGGLPPNRL